MTKEKGVKYKFECNIMKTNQEIEKNDFYSGEYTLKCKGFLNSNIHNIKKYKNSSFFTNL